MKKKMLSSFFLLSFLALNSLSNGSSLSLDWQATKLAADQATVEDYDVVGTTHIKLDEFMFEEIMAEKPSAAYDESLPDFNRDGVERMLTTYDYAPNSADDVFTNYVDGDTTQFTSYNGLYTVKVRYLAVDTPESTSEIEEWGKAASLFNQSKLKNAKHIIVQSAASAKGNPEYGYPCYAPADIDTYQRSLAYVWYTDVEDPTIEDFRNLNLELVYEGYSLFNGEVSEMDPDFYQAFMDASIIAEEQKKGRYAETWDDHYYYGHPIELKLSDIYDERFYIQHEDGYYSMYCDEFTKYTFEGVVTRTAGTAFYIQDTYDQNDRENSTYGLYVFTNKSYYPVQVGNRIRVTGCLSYYGGSYELTGISYNFFNHAEGDIEFVDDAEGNHITESVDDLIIDATAEEISQGKYNAVLVRLVDEEGNPETVYFNTVEDSEYGNNYAYGGSQEFNTYNETYPFYNTDNDIVVFGRAGEDMEPYDGGFASLLADESIVRFSISDNALVRGDYKSIVYSNIGGVLQKTDVDNTSTAVTSYQYYTGGTNVYIPGSHEVVGRYADGTEATYTISYATEAKAALEEVLEGKEPTVPEDTTLYVTEFNRKKVTDIVGIAMNYVSTGGNQKYSMTICEGTDLGEITEIA